MSYIAFDLDALNLVPSVAAAAGLRPGDVSHGLLTLWAYCFREELEVASEVHLRGFFGGADVAPALEAFGFAERAENGWRVRGAQRYLRISESKRAAGRARAASARRNTDGTLAKRPARRPAQPAPAGESTSTPPAQHQQPASGEPALSPTTEHRTPSLKELADGPPDAARLQVVPQEKKTKSEKTPEPDLERRRSLLARLKATYLATMGEAYLSAKPQADNVALKELSEAFSDEAIERRWAEGLRTQGWGGFRTIAQMLAMWTQHAKPKPAGSGLRKLGPEEMP